ncbi:MAG TPA: hypothetical protein ENO09_00500, partial [bacterium]|nr:hypothetical protein [bacterium]
MATNKSMLKFLFQFIIGALAALGALSAIGAYTRKKREEREALERLQREKAELEQALGEKQRDRPMSASSAPPGHRHAFWVWLYSNGNLLGSALALLGLGLYFSGLIGGDWWWIVPGLYLAGFLI